MKKLFGCLLVFGLFIIVGAIAVYLLLIRPLGGMADDFRATVEELRTLDELDAQVTNTNAFTEPEDGLLTEEQVARFAAVANAVEDASSAELDALGEKYAEIRDRAQESRLGSLQPRMILEAFADFSATLRTAKEAQIAALNAQSFSVAEYEWVRREVFRAGGMAVMPADLDQLRNIDLKNLDDLRNLPGIGQEEAQPVEEPSEPAPPSNVALIEPYRDDLMGWARGAALGL